MKACTVAALSVTFFAKAEAWFEQKLYSAAGCGADALMSLDITYLESFPCEQTTCGDGTCYQQASCNNATHMKLTYYADDKCTTVHATHNGGNPAEWGTVCNEITPGKQWRTMTCLDSAPATTLSYDVFGSEDCSGDPQRITTAWQDCVSKGEYTNGAWVSKSEGFAKEGESTVVTQYDTLDCSGTPTSTQTYPCGQCTNGINPPCPAASSSSRASPKAILAAAAAVLVAASRLQ